MVVAARLRGMAKKWIAVAAVAGVLVLGGGVAVAATGALTPGEPEVQAGEPAATAVPAEPTPTPDPTEPAVDVEALTAPGGVCYAQSGDDFPCLVVAPDLAVINMTGPGRAVEPLISMPEADRIALAHQACNVLASGGSHESVTLVESADAQHPTANNFVVFSAGASAYCPEYADQWVQDELAEAAAAG